MHAIIKWGIGKKVFFFFSPLLIIFVCRERKVTQADFAGPARSRSECGGSLSPASDRLIMGRLGRLRPFASY